MNELTRASECKDAMFDGLDACRNGVPFDDCPYNEGTYLGNAWRKGWLMAEAIEWGPEAA